MVDAPVSRNELTSEQMDRVVAIDAYQRDPEKAKKLAYLAHEVFRAQVPTNPLSSLDYCLDCLNPLSILTNPQGPNALIPPPLPGATARERMSAAADNAWLQTQDPGAKFREAGADLLFYGGLDVAAAALSGVAPVTAIARVLYPPLKTAAGANVEEVSSRTPNLTADFTTNWVAWTYQQVRENTDAGQEIGRYFVKLSDNDVHEDLNEKASVVRAVTRIDALRAAAAAKSADVAAAEILEEQSKQYNLESELSAKLDDIDKTVKALAAPRPPPPDVSALRNAQGALQLTSYLLGLTGEEKGARTAATFADAAGKVGDLIEKAANMAPMLLAAGYVGIAIAVFSALQSSKESGPPYAAIFDQLRRISEQIEALRKDMLDKLAKMDTRLGNLLEHSMALERDTLADVEAALVRINEVQETLGTILGRITIESAAVNARLQAEEDNNCILVSGDRHFLPPRDGASGLVYCRETYVSRATKFSRMGASIAATDGKGIFPYAARYEVIRDLLGITLPNSHPPVPNPDIWHDGVSKLLILAQHVPGFLDQIIYDKASGTSPTIDPVSAAGGDILNFRYQLFSDWGDGKSRFSSAHADRLFAIAIDERREVARQISARLETAGLGLRVELGGDQPINPAFNFEFLSTGWVDYDHAHNVTPVLTSVKHVQMTFSGGASGYDLWVNQDQVDREEHSPHSPLSPPIYPWGFDHLSLRDRVGGSIRGVPARNLRMGKEILDVLPRPLLLIEQAALGGKLIARITRFEITSLDMPNPKTATAVLNFAIKLFLQYRGAPENAAPAGEYQGSFPISFPSFNLIYDQETRGSVLVNEIWSVVAKRLGELKITDTSRGDPGITTAGQVVNDFIRVKQDELMHAAVSAEEVTRVDQSRQDLIAAITIGLNLELMTVDDLVRFLSADDTLPSAPAIVERMIRHGYTLARILGDLDSAKAGYQKRMAAVGEEASYLPVPNLIEQRLAELGRLRAARAAS